MVHILRWLYLNFKYRVCILPNDPVKLEKLGKDLQIPLAFTYKSHGIDITLAQQRIRQSLNSFRWIAPLVLALLCFALMITAIFESVPPFRSLKLNADLEGPPWAGFPVALRQVDGTGSGDKEGARPVL